jgi:uncharacterized protein HemY
MWFLTLAMIISVTSMTHAYVNAVALVTPKVFYSVNILVDLLQEIWMGVVIAIDILIHIIRPLSWMVKKLHNFRRDSKTGRAKNPTNV